MSIPFNDTVNKNGIIQIAEQNCKLNDGDISGDVTLMAQFTAGINLAIDEVLGFMFPLGGTWQLDDYNQTGYPIITTDLVSGQRDYTFVSDGAGNIVLDIYRVMVKDNGGIYKEILPIDQDTPNNTNQNTDSFIDGRNTSGIPKRYDKLGNGIFLDPIPNYNSTAGLKVMINREATYFVVGDTTKKVGFASLFHEYFALSPSYKYARTKDLDNKNDLKTDMLAMQEAIKKYYGKREKDVKNRMSPGQQNNH